MSAAYLNQKRSAGYTEKRGSWYTRSCDNCSHLRHPVFSAVVRLQCEVIGVADDPDADVLPGASCKAWKGRVR